MRKFKCVIFLLFFSACSRAHTLDPENFSIIKIAPKKQIAYQSHDFSWFIGGFLEGQMVQMNSVTHSLKKQRIYSVNWLESIFPSMGNCTPIDLHYDDQIKRSNNDTLEKMGYRVYKVNEYLAHYEIKEKFFGFDAIEIAIPSSTDSIYTITVRAGAKNLAEAIKYKTGYKLPLYNKKFEAQSAMPYLISEGANKTTFVCFTFNGGF